MTSLNRNIYNSGKQDSQAFPLEFYSSRLRLPGVGFLQDHRPRVRKFKLAASVTHAEKSEPRLTVWLN